MNVLGINCSLHDISIAYFRDGELEFAIEEERLVKEKHKSGILLGGEMPKESLKILLKKYDLNEIDYFCYAGDIFFQPIQYAESSKKIYTMAKQLDDKLEKSFFVDHHTCHALSAFAESDFENAGVVVVDGEGDACSVSIFSVDSDDIVTKMKFPPTSSLGNLYSYITNKLGFTCFGDEGKTMALASYGKEIDGYENIIKYSHDYLEVDWTLARILVKDINNQTSFEEKADIACTVQKSIERAMIWLVDLAVKITGYSNICISGGVAYNCKSNANLLNKSKAKAVFVPNMPGDSGLSVGAAVYAYYKLKHKTKFTISPYVGTGYSDAEVEKILNHNFIHFSYEPQYQQLAAEILSKGNIVLWFNRKMEFGPRALGNRSILGPIHVDGIANHINESIKHRQLWRPFAPAVPQYMAKEYFERDVYSPYMSFAVEVKEKYRQVFKEVMSIDGCARVQTVDYETNCDLFDIIENYGELTGNKALLNTSFNDKGKPIVESLEDALAFFYTSRVKYMFINGYLIEK